MLKILRSVFLYCQITILLSACTNLDSELDPNLLDSIRWYTGEAGEVDDQRARQLLLQSVETGDAVSTMWLARVYSTGRMTFPEDRFRAIEIASSVIEKIESMAEAGVVEAMFLLGTAYAEGLGKEINAELAVNWYRRAGEMGNTLAQHNMGNAYAAGVGVQQSDSLAVQWWLLAAEQGDAIPQYRLGEMYEQGRGVAPDLNKAIRWYQRSAERGYTSATLALRRLGF